MKNDTFERLRHRIHTVIYEADSPAGKLFDLVLLALIVISIAAVMLESVAGIHSEYGPELVVVEWIITIFFTIEYIGRLIALRKPLKYVLSLYGIIDLLALLPAYIDLIFPGWHFLVALRAFRLLRIFRILKLVHFVGAGNRLLVALRQSSTKIFVFLFAVLVMCVILGTLMFLIEGGNNGFSSIPKSIYWTIVTLTTVGFGDITPQTPLGQFVSIVIMILGYGIIAVPTGLITAQIISRNQTPEYTQMCVNCGADHHPDNAEFCYKCGVLLNPFDP